MTMLASPADHESTTDCCPPSDDDLLARGLMTTREWHAYLAKKRNRAGEWAPHVGSRVPNLNMVGTFYGVTVDDCGEDGDAFALGHVGKYRALAAFMRHSRENRGDDILGYRLLLDDALKRIQHLWMVNLGTDDLWLIREAEPTDPGAFPVTWWNAP